MFELFIALCVILVCLLYKSTRKPDKFPPGPPTIPFLGAATLFPKEVKDGKKKFQTHMQETYGPISGAYLNGRNPTVVLSDFEVIKELYKR